MTNFAKFEFELERRRMKLLTNNDLTSFYFPAFFFQNRFLTAYKHKISEKSAEKIVKSLLSDNFGEIPATV